MSARITAAMLAALAVTAGEALALPHSPSVKGTPLQQAREEAGVVAPLQRTEPLPAGLLRLSESELLAASGQTLGISVTLDRAVESARLDLDLPARWIARSGVSGLRYAKVPASGRGVRRSARTVSFAFESARAGDVASFELTDVGIPAGEYALPYRWTERGGRPARGAVRVRFYAPTREAQSAGSEWSRLASPGFENNATQDGADESETFVTVVPGNRDRFVVGANGGGGYNAWVTDDGGTTFTKAAMPATTDAPGEASPETSNLCCDPMSAADAAGNIWYGGLSRHKSTAEPSRIVVNRIAPGQTTFQPVTTGLAQRTLGTQDKPMMTIDNSPSSPRFGRLYVVWGEPGVRIVISQCDTRPGGALDAARCDNADNWTVPVSVTPSAGSYIYADVAAAPDGTVHVVWWDYSAANAIRGESCGPAEACASAAAWGTPQTIATLDATNGAPIPFACPIVAQPGGRASTSPQVDVDRSGGDDHGRVYVTWSDLRTGSGSTRCAGGQPPQTTHLTFDSFVASKAGGLPGSANPSPSVGTRLLTEAEDPNADDWFAWLAVDQTTGQAWADFYSTREDATRQTTNFYVRTVTPSGGGHALGALTKVTDVPSDYSWSPCCAFDNEYGDYSGIDATDGVALPVWSDRRGGEPADGEAYTFTAASIVPVAVAPAVSDDEGDGDGTLEPGERFSLTQPLRNDGTMPATGVTATLADSPDVAADQRVSAYPRIDVGATRTNTTRYTGTVRADLACGATATTTLAVASAQGDFSLPVGIPTGGAGTACTPPPAAPVLTGTDPPSPAADTTPIVRGSAPGGTAVAIYTGGTCTGTPAATGSAAEFGATGLEITVPPAATTVIRATASAGGFTSVCSPPLEYVVAAPPAAAPAPAAPARAADREIAVNLTAAALQRALRTRGVRLAVVCPAEACAVSASAVLTIKRKKLRSRTARRTLRAAQRATLTLRLSKSLTRRLRAALRGRRARVPAKITVTVTDAAGNTATRSVTVRLRR